MHYSIFNVIFSLSLLLAAWGCVFVGLQRKTDVPNYFGQVVDSILLDLKDIVRVYLNHFLIS